MADPSFPTKQSSEGTAEAPEQVRPECLEEPQDATATEGEEVKELVAEKPAGQAEEEGSKDDKEVEEEGLEDSKLLPSLEEPYETNIEVIGAQESVLGLRRRFRPE